MLDEATDAPWAPQLGKKGGTGVCLVSGQEENAGMGSNLLTVHSH